VNALAQKLAARIASDGPLSIEEFMTACLLDPDHGYYSTRDPFGAPGDFVTAPEISQMFGELIGLWLWSVWQGAGRPDHAHLVELGPGRGTLMADALRAIERATRADAPFIVHLVEASPTLRERQRKALSGRAVHWHETLATLPKDGALFFVANEFFDALPIRQFVSTTTGWRERKITSQEAELVPILVQEPTVSVLPDAPIGRVGELAPQRVAVAAQLAERVAEQGGAALIIDFTDPALPIADTFQAVRAHRYADRFEAPGDADLASAVDFTALADEARAAGVKVCGPVGQGHFLHSLGIEARCEALATNARDDQAQALRLAMERLVSPEGMGEDFQVLALMPQGQETPAGFEGLHP
jgi:NADH dehydrogenase [ubiquinone] 1 alpha subcomplex assembly factor 7